MKNQKLSKGVLKEIVKECLIEILAEGLTSTSNNRETIRKSKTLKESIMNSSESISQNTSRKNKKPSYLDSINFEPKEDMQKNKKLDEIASSVTTDPILSEMLQDTAHTTLQEQIAAESKKGYAPSGTGDQAQRIVETAEDPADLFGEETSSKWASLAFNF